jgi:hypothetical protein
MSLRDWFLAPPPETDPRPWAPSGEEDAAEWAPPADAAPERQSRRTTDQPDAEWAPPIHARPPTRDHPIPAQSAFVAGHGPGFVGSAAVLGRPGDAEPMAAAVALALRRPARARAAAVVVIGGEPPPPDAPEGGTPAARRLAARLAAHGFEATGRGRLAWTHAPPELALRAAIAGAPAVLAITAPLTPALEGAMAEQDLAVVLTPDPDGPLAQLALPSLEHLTVPVLTSTPLPRGLARRFAHAGLRTPRSVTELIASGSRTTFQGDGR